MLLEQPDLDLIRPLIPGPWGNEFSHVMDIDVDGSTGKVRITAGGPQIWLAGHGIHTVLYNSMAENLVKWIGAGLLLVMKELGEKTFERP